MYDYRCKECENFGECMSMANMSMMNMPMGESDDEDLKSMYPKVYIRIYPMVKHHYDMIVAKHGRMYCPSKDKMDNMCKDICDKYKKNHKDEDNDDMRQYGYRFYGGGGLGDIVRILLIGNLLGGRNY
ncbi:hypothetical protein [Clostridium psychrophilum]|uniref:hypothetical protein n=1 Tax=Clostridium psychrophilum TaxID=132926 RepID=UPI001C0BEEC5|nr:hypothetical protein [Clostridium psychrophilum]MBU3180271.1 hypothetical protein [Clostridium psychrophilum]